MNANEIEKSFKHAVSKSVTLFAEGVDRFKVFTPFHFDDGDHFVIVLRKGDGNRWVITDEGHTYMHLSYRMDVASLESGSRNKIIESALEKNGVRENGRQLVVELDAPENAGNIFYNFIQCLINITDVTYLSRERVISTFMDDFRLFIKETVVPERLKFDYYYAERDSERKYPVDCFVNGIARPWHLHAINNDSKCRNVTVYIRQFQQWDVPFQTLAIFEDQESINRKVLSRFTDVCDRQFSNLTANKPKIEEILTTDIPSRHQLEK